MVRKKQADKTELITDILVKMEAALAEVFAYYKFGRYEGTFWGKPYFLLSHCARLVFSLWLIDEDSGWTIFRGAPCPAALVTRLDFGSLRHVDDARRILQAESSQDPLKNEPRWFNSWMQILDGLTYPGSPDSQESAHQVLIPAGHRAFLDGEMPRRDRRTIKLAVKTEQVGRLLLRSMSVLKDAIWAMTYYLAALDSRTCFPEQVRALTCLLSQIRRTIVCETPATGPYVPSNAKGWAMPPLLSRLYFGKTRGVLKVVLRREGGGVICTYDWTSDSGPNRRSWTCSLSALKGTYEESLFRTWAYETGECRHDGAGPSGERACWMVQSTEAGLLRSISRHAEALFRALGANPICSGMVEAVAGIVGNNDMKGRRSVLPWTCVRQLDQVLEQLKSVYRAAAVADEDNPVEQLIAEMWPVQHMKVRWTHRQLSENPPGEVTSQPGARPDDGVSTTVGESAVPSSADAEPAGGSQSPLPDQAVASSSLLTGEPPGERVSGDPVIQASDNRMAECPAEKAQEQSDSSESNVRGEIQATADCPTAAADAASCDAMPTGLEVQSTVLKSEDEPELHSGTAQASAPPQACGSQPACSARSLEDRDAKTDSGAAELIANGSCQRMVQETPLRADAAAEREAPEAHTQPKAPEEAVPREQPVDAARGDGGHKSRATIVVSKEDDEGQPVCTTDTPSGGFRTTADNPLLRRLLEHHRCRPGKTEQAPVSLIQLQRDLAWSRSKVQCAMADMFGCQPFSVYKKKCTDHTILAFLRKFAGERPNPSNARARKHCVNARSES